MGSVFPKRARYRVRQFVEALMASASELDDAEQAEVRAYLPDTAWQLFQAMPRSDQRHSLRVLRSLQSAGYTDLAITQAALLHDCAKQVGGVRIWHRVAVVLLKAFWPGLLARWTDAEPTPASWRHPFWTQLNHPARGAELAQAAGCDPLAVALIHSHHPGGRHQDVIGDEPDSMTSELLAAFQTADDDN